MSHGKFAVCLGVKVLSPNTFGVTGTDACLSRSISWVQVPPSACWYGLFLAYENGLLAESARAWVSYIRCENLRAAGTLRATKKKGTYRGGRWVGTCDHHGLSRSSLRVKPLFTSYQLGWKVKGIEKEQQQWAMGVFIKVRFDFGLNQFSCEVWSSLSP